MVDKSILFLAGAIFQRSSRALLGHLASAMRTRCGIADNVTTRFPTKNSRLPELIGSADSRNEIVNDWVKSVLDRRGLHEDTLIASGR